MLQYVMIEWHKMIIAHDTHLVETLWSNMTWWIDVILVEISVRLSLLDIWYDIVEIMWHNLVEISVIYDDMRSRRDLLTPPVIFLRIPWHFRAVVIECSLRSQGSDTYKMIVKDSILRMTINKHTKHSFIFKITFFI